MSEATTGLVSRFVAMLGCCLALAGPGASFTHGEPADDVVLRAIVDEVERAMADLKLEGLPAPYFIQVNAQEQTSWSIRASYGGLIDSRKDHNRFAYARTRVGSFTLDNTNVPRSYGLPGLLPLDDDYPAIRQALWLMLDQDYKNAVEMLARKQAYLKAKSVEDRPPDFTDAPPVVASTPPVVFPFDPGEWERRILELSSRFQRFPKIQDSNVSLRAGVAIEWIVTSQGTRLRKEDSGLYLEVRAKVQASDGMPLSDTRTYLAEHAPQLPSIEQVENDIDEMCEKLVALSEAPVLEQYTGPVLFDAPAAGAVFSSLLSEGLPARPVPLGGGRWSDRSFEKKLGLRILPRSFRAFDDPRIETFNDKVLAGAYDYDDEATPATRVEVVEKGKLLNLLASRTPTKKVKATTGHGRSGGFGDARATIGCLFLEDADAVSTEELRAELIDAARDEGLPIALRIESLEPSESRSLGNPLGAYKIDVETGKQELVRGLRFLDVEPRSMKRILAAGKNQAVYNDVGSIGSSVIAPAVVFEELELTKVESQFDKLPILPPPARRK